MADAAMRLDTFLWFTRFAKTRSLAQAIVMEGRMRLDGRVVSKCACPVRPGSVLSFALHDRVRVIRIEAIPHRRGPAPEAALCFTDLSPTVDGADSAT